MQSRVAHIAKMATNTAARAASTMPPVHIAVPVNNLDAGEGPTGGRVTRYERSWAAHAPA